MTASEVLRQAAALIEAGWSQGDSHAQDALGDPVTLFGGTAGDTARAGINPAATRFTLYGAVVKALHMMPGIDPRRIWIKLELLVQRTGYTAGGTNHLHPVIGYNNAEGRTAAEVQALLLLAAEELDAHAPNLPAMPPEPRFIAVDPASPGSDTTVQWSTKPDGGYVYSALGKSPFEGME